MALSCYEEMDTKSHWEGIYTTKAETEVSWFQAYPKGSVELIEWLQLPLTARIIDIGGGDSHLADVLSGKGYRNLWVLDISVNAIERAKKRWGEKAGYVHWIASDVTMFEPPLQFDCWHDRAAFHFLTTKDKISRYVAIAGKAVKKGGYLVLGTFSEQGQKKCSGLEIKQYSETSMTTLFAPSFQKIKCIYEDHVTPSGAVQNFLFCIFRRK